MKKMIILAAALTLSALTTVSQAANISIGGTVDASTGALSSLYEVGTAFTGELVWSGTLDGAWVNLGGECFTSNASGVGTLNSPAGNCGGPLLAPVTPVLATGETGYDGTPAAPGSTFQQAGTTFDGTSGNLNLLVFSSVFQGPIPITLSFIGDGTGSFFVNGGQFGTVGGAFTATSDVPIPAAAWLFGSGLIGLAAMKRKRS